MNFKTVPLLLNLLLLVGCANNLETRFYLLSSIPEHGVEPFRATPRPSATIAVGPISLPDYLDRPQIVTAQSSNRMKMAEFDQWAEPVQDNFRRVMSENLAQRVPNDQFLRFPWEPSIKVDYQLKIDVLRFMVDQHNVSWLSANWRIIDIKQRKPSAQHRSDIHQPVSGSGYEAIVKAQSESVAALSQLIANELKRVITGAVVKAQ